MKRLKQFIVPLALSISFSAFGEVPAAEKITCQTKKHRIEIGSEGHNKATYKSWSKSSSSEAKPDMELSGEMDVEGTNPCTHDIYTFRNGQYVYEFVGFTACSEEKEPKNTLGTLVVKKGNKTLLEDYCVAP